MRSNPENILILGAGAIGNALVDNFKKAYPTSNIIYTSRTCCNDELQCWQHNPLKDESWKKLQSRLKEKLDHLDIVISTYGSLYTAEYGPEKKLEDINMAQMLETFQVNAFSAPLSAKYLLPFFRNEKRSVLAFLSAKVGSISDNRMGGWYSYRASKTALNMFIKNISIEYDRLKLNTSVLAIHPGTTKSKLSEPFLSSTNLKAWTPEETAEHIIQTISSSAPKESGVFKNWDGINLPW